MVTRSTSESEVIPDDYLRYATVLLTLEKNEDGELQVLGDEECSDVYDATTQEIEESDED